MKVDDIANTTITRAFFSAGQIKPADDTTSFYKKQARNPGEKEKHEIVTPSQDRIQYSRFENAIAAAHSLVQGIRSVDRTMEKIAGHVEKMEQSLSNVTKSYPPFPVGSNERIAQLRQFSSLRKMIDQLTVPPREEASPVKILGDADAYETAGDLSLITGNKNETLTIRHQPMHPGPKGLDIPDLPEGASDETINATLTKLADAGDKIQRKRREFILDANRVIAAMV